MVSVGKMHFNEKECKKLGKEGFFAAHKHIDKKTLDKVWKKVSK